MIMMCLFWFDLIQPECVYFHSSSYSMGLNNGLYNFAEPSFKRRKKQTWCAYHLAHAHMLYTDIMIFATLNFSSDKVYFLSPFFQTMTALIIMLENLESRAQVRFFSNIYFGSFPVFFPKCVALWLLCSSFPSHHSEHSWDTVWLMSNKSKAAKSCNFGQPKVFIGQEKIDEIKLNFPEKNINELSSW